MRRTLQVPRPPRTGIMRKGVNSEMRQTLALRHDTRGDPGMNVGHWTYLIVAAFVLVIVVAALLGPLKTGLASYAANDTTFGPILQNIVPILIGVGILLAFVG